MQKTVEHSISVKTESVHRGLSHQLRKIKKLCLSSFSWCLFCERPPFWIIYARSTDVRFGFGFPSETARNRKFSARVGNFREFPNLTTSSRSSSYTTELKIFKMAALAEQTRNQSFFVRLLFFISDVSAPCKEHVSYKQNGCRPRKVIVEAIIFFGPASQAWVSQTPTKISDPTNHFKLIHNIH